MAAILTRCKALDISDVRQADQLKCRLDPDTMTIYVRGWPMFRSGSDLWRFAAICLNMCSASDWNLREFNNWDDDDGTTGQDEPTELFINRE
jgi:hypothetical protein